LYFQCFNFSYIAFLYFQCFCKARRMFFRRQDKAQKDSTRHYVIAAFFVSLLVFLEYTLFKYWMFGIPMGNQMPSDGCTSSSGIKCNECMTTLKLSKLECETRGFDCKCIYDVVHVIAPFLATEDNLSYQFFSQPVAMSSIMRARDFAKQKGIRVQIIIFGSTSDLKYASKYIKDAIFHTSTRCGSDIAPPTINLKCIPLVQDMFNTLYDLSGANIAVYTNSDIGLYEDFYIRISNITKYYAGISVMRTNIPKRSISGHRYDKRDLDLIYGLKNITWGHPGGDTFIWRKDIFSKDELNLQDMIVGATLWDGFFKLILSSKVVEGHLYHREDSGALTFHLGTDYGWEKTNRSNSMSNCWNIVNVARIIKPYSYLYNVTTEFNTTSRFRRLQYALCRFGRHYQCGNFPIIFDHFYEDYNFRKDDKVDRLCLFNHKLRCNPPKYRDAPKVLSSFNELPCQGSCLGGGEGFPNFYTAWKECETRIYCHIIMRAPNRTFYIRKSDPGLAILRNRTSGDPYIYTYRSCPVEYRENALNNNRMFYEKYRQLTQMTLFDG